jgi:hypothetical protein
MRRFVCWSIVLSAMYLSVSILGCGGGGSLTSNNSPGGPGPTPTPTPGSPQAHSVSVSWTPSTSSGVTSYNVYRSATSGGPYARVGNTGSSSFTDNTVQGGATYFYVVTALNAAQVESPVSTEIKVTVPTP